ncbi:MAG: hypothetical protein FJX76_01490 [Armatimonadetes bacterium]|nr:hypothetical protein [Armatimonadota bacterium]MBM3738937.1 hypothetical protein [Acidobacteriota bacterium]
MASVLDSIPGLGGYEAQRRANEGRTLDNLRQVVGVQALIGQMQAQAERARQIERAKAYETAVQGLGPNPTAEQLEGVVVQHAGPEGLLRSLDRRAVSADRLAIANENRAQAALQFAQNLQLRQDMLEQRRTEAEARITDASARRQFDEWYKRESLANKQQQAQLNSQMRMMGFEIQRQGQQLQLARLDQAKEQKTGRDVQQLGAALEKANLPEADAVLEEVETALTRTPQLTEWLSGPKSAVPDRLAPAEIRAGRQAFQKLFNITLKNRSGAAVTIPEFERLKSEFGSGLFKTPDGPQNAVNQARTIINKHYASVASGFGKDVLDRYNESVRQFRGRVVLEPSETSVGPQPPPPPGFKVNP